MVSIFFENDYHSLFLNCKKSLTSNYAFNGYLFVHTYTSINSNKIPTTITCIVKDNLKLDVWCVWYTHSCCLYANDKYMMSIVKTVSHFVVYAYKKTFLRRILFKYIYVQVIPLLLSHKLLEKKNKANRIRF